MLGRLKQKTGLIPGLLTSNSILGDRLHFLTAHGHGTLVALFTLAAALGHGEHEYRGDADEHVDRPGDHVIHAESEELEQVHLHQADKEPVHSADEEEDHGNFMSAAHFSHHVDVDNLLMGVDEHRRHGEMIADSLEGCTVLNFMLRIRRELMTTEIEERAMAADAIMGVSRPKAAIGMAMML